MRRASHAGSWYSASQLTLNKELECWLADSKKIAAPAKAIIAPHAGYRYSGPCAAWAYKQLNPSEIKRIFLLGPAHHVHIPGCALTRNKEYQTPLFNIRIDRDLTDTLAKTGMFQIMDSQTDEEEHSIEMHLPYIAKVMKDADKFTLVPILVGSMTPDKEREYGRLLAPFFLDPANAFIISSDFCHWGSRFSYSSYDSSKGEIWQHIEDLDREGMRLIENLDFPGFTSYLKRTKNTICGRHPISVLLAIIEAIKSGDVANGHTNGSTNGTSSPQQFRLRFVQYAQSNQVRSPQDSSVSYASASLVMQ